MKRTIKNIYIILSLLSGLFLTSCGVDPVFVTVSSPESLVAKMNNYYDGTFTYESHEYDGDKKYIKVIMTCEVDGRILENVTISESHKFNNMFVGDYYEISGSLYTNYYAVRYGEEIGKKFKDKITDYFTAEKTAVLPEMDVYIGDDTNITNIDNRFNSIDEYYKYLQNNGRIVTRIVLNCPKPDETDKNQDFDLLLTALCVECPCFDGVCIYDPSNILKDNPLDLTIDDLIEKGISYKVFYKDY